MDPLSDVLSLLHVESATSGRLEAGGNWALRSSAQEHITFCALLSGPCWLITSDRDDPIEMKPGDCLLATDSAAVRLCSDPAMNSPDGVRTLAPAAPALLRIGDGAETSLIGARFRFDEAYAKSILRFLPATIHIRAGTPSAASLQTILYKLQDEIDVPRLGRELVVDHLVHLALVQAMRGYLTCKEQCPRNGWLGALADRQISAALHAMHEEVTRRWTVAELGASVGMSRSSFAQRFKALVGIPPLDYLTQWRIYLAGQALQRNGNAISAVAAEFGYESESAFSTAFKRVMGCSPRDFRAGRRHGADGSQVPMLAAEATGPRPRLPVQAVLNGHHKASAPGAE